MVRWYIEHALPWLQDRVARHAGRVGVQPTAVTVQDLGYRWGSCGKERRLHFHWQVILLPPRIIEYVVVHELVHLSWPHHTPEFWRAVEAALPGWEARRRWLTEHGGEFAV